jgi:hypothetical protein
MFPGGLWDMTLGELLLNRYRADLKDPKHWDMKTALYFFKLRRKLNESV